ncbi:helix-turn-helix domain-containing protein [Streptomyces sp. NPDC093801]|uniref:helix-turn-helix domain-containing protein n=1 Tax=Streptomyces sp. NPDC093801 TaxID=3155203 RepID=UPI00344CDFF7
MSRRVGSVPALADLATFLREQRAKSNVSYAVLAKFTALSEATLKRAAAGSTLPAWTAVEQYLRACVVKRSQQPHMMDFGRIISSA